MNLCRSLTAGSACNLLLRLRNRRWSSSCRRTVLVEDLCLKVEVQWEEVSRLHSIRDGKKKIGQILSKRIWRAQVPSVSKKDQSLHVKLGSGDCHDDTSWKLVTFGIKKKAPAPPENLQLRNRFSTLVKEEGLGEWESELCLKWSSVSNKPVPPTKGSSDLQYWETLCHSGQTHPCTQLFSCLERFAEGLDSWTYGNIAVSCVNLMLSPSTAHPHGHWGYCYLRRSVNHDYIWWGMLMATRRAL